MKKYDLFRNEDTIFRVLEIKLDRVLMIDCIKRTMPVWVEPSALNSFRGCTDNELAEITSATVADIGTLGADQRKIMYDRYTLIAPILPFVADDKMRSRLICSIAAEHEVSKQTIRNYLCLYLVYMDMAVLTPKKRIDDVDLSSDEKNMRWALNKFFYTTAKQSLTTAYTMMLKEKYCDNMGVLMDTYPSFYQFRYFYRKTRKMQNFYISRDGLKSYQRNNRPLTGEGVQEFAPAVGVGMLDATICDIYLVNDAGNLVGRPILTACIDTYSGLCCGYALSWEGGVYSLRGLMLNIIADKSAWCRKFGIALKPDDWSCNKLPATLVTDMGSEYKSENFEQIAELGVKVINLPSYRHRVVPCIIVQCPFDSSVKGLLLEVLRKVDEVLDSKYYQNALRARATTDMLIGSVSQVALNHIGMLVVDEIQNVANSKNGKSLIGALTQLINNSGISICMVGTPESTRFFESAMQLARRSVGLQYTTMGYDAYFQQFCKVMFSYQYTQQKTEITDGILEWLYEHSAGVTSVVVALIHDAQEIAILNGKEALNLESLNEAYEQRLSLLHGYIQPSIPQAKQTSKAKKRTSVADLKTTDSGEVDGGVSIADLVAKAKDESMDIVQLLKAHMPVVEVAV